MSYMNDDTDPFGVPYSSTVCSKKEIKEYSFEDLKKIDQKEIQIQQELYGIQNEKDRAMEYLREKLKKYVNFSDKIELKDDPHLKCRIISKKFDLNQLKKIKEDFDIKNIEVELGHVMGEPKEKIIITLKW